MNRMLYIAMSGAKEVSLSQANNANNLANANTDGFKKDFNQFRAQHVEGPGWNSRAYAMNERPATDFSPGAVKVTGRTLDVMTNESGFMVVQTPGGAEGLVRSAALRLTPEGDLVDKRGNPVLNEGGVPVSIPPYRAIEVASDGTISIIPSDSQTNLMVDVDQLKLVSPDVKELEKGLDGYIHSTGANLAQADVQVTSGALETSNVNTVEALTNMIELSRKYEMQIKMMKTTKEHAQKSDSLLKIS